MQRWPLAQPAAMRVGESQARVVRTVGEGREESAEAAMLRRIGFEAEEVDGMEMSKTRR